jgi:hypothetical protein
MYHLIWELLRNKLSRTGAELVVLSEAGNRSATLCNTRFSNEAQDNQGKPEVCELFLLSSLDQDGQQTGCCPSVHYTA